MPIVSTSTSAFYERARTSMQDLRASAETLQSQLGSGQKLTRASDDPVAAARMRTLSRQETLSTIDTTNADRANADLTLADAALTNMANAIIRAQELATRAASTTLTDQQRASIAGELDQIHGDLFSLANARDSNGHALFGGESSGNAYELDGTGNAIYIGTDGSGDLPIGDGQSVTRSVTGPQIFEFTDANGNTTDVMATVRNLAEALKSAGTDAPAAANDALNALGASLNTVTTGQTVVGTRLSWLEVTSERRTTLSEMRATEKADLGGTDIASTVAKLQETLTVLEASQASFTKLSSLSLINQLR